jgi:hypothetical protein
LKKEKFIDWLFDLPYPARIRVLEAAESVMELKKELRKKRREKIHEARVAKAKKGPWDELRKLYP